MSISNNTGKSNIGFNNSTIQDLTSYNYSAFNVLKVAPAFTLADLVSKYGRDQQEFGAYTASGGVVSDVLTESAINLAVNGTNGSTAKIRTHTYFRYQAGKGQQIMVTCHHADVGKTNQTRRWGYFDDNDGLFFELNGTTLKVVRRTSVSGVVVDNPISQVDWNTDKYADLDLRNGNIYEIRFQWLGVGDVWFYINERLVHCMEHKNKLPVVYMRTASLPVSLEVINTAVSTASSMTAICASVISEGGSSPPEYSWAAYNSANITIGGNASRPILSIRPMAAFKTLVNRVLVIPLSVSMSSETNRAAMELVMNATLGDGGTPPSWSSVNSESAVEYDVAADTISGGEPITRIFAPSSGVGGAVAILDLIEIFGHVFSRRKLRQSAFATSLDTLTLVAYNEQGGNSLFRGNLTWGEIR